MFLLPQSMTSSALALLLRMSMNQTHHTLFPCPMSPTLPESSNQEPQTLSLITDSSSNMSPSPSPSETCPTNHPSLASINTAHLRDTKMTPSPSSETPSLMFQPPEPPTYTYMVSLLHALPFLFQIEPLLASQNKGTLWPLELLELAEISWVSDTTSSHGMI